MRGSIAFCWARALLRDDVVQVGSLARGESHDGMHEVQVDATGRPLHEVPKPMGALDLLVGPQGASLLDNGMMFEAMFKRSHSHSVSWTSWADSHAPRLAYCTLASVLLAYSFGAAILSVVQLRSKGAEKPGVFDEADLYVDSRTYHRRQAHEEDDGDETDGVDSLGIEQKFSQQAQRDQAMINMLFALCLPGIMTFHWRGSHSEYVLNDYGVIHDPYADQMNLPLGFATVFCTVLYARHAVFNAYIVASGFMHGGETSGQWKKTLLIYAVYFGLAWPWCPIVTYFGADLNAIGRPENAHRWFLIMMVIARAYTSVVEAARIPPFVQSLALFAGLCVYASCTNQRHAIFGEPDGDFWSYYGFPLLAKPPYVGDMLCGHLYPGFNLRLSLLHNLAFHYLRPLRKFASGLPYTTALALTGFIVAAAAEVHFGPFNNMFSFGAEHHGLGTTRGLKQYLCEIVVVNIATLSLMALCYKFPWRPLQWLGQCTFASYLTHTLIEHRAGHFIAKLPRLSGWAEGPSAIAGMLSCEVGFTACAGLLMFGAVGLWGAAGRTLRAHAKQLQRCSVPFSFSPTTNFLSRITEKTQLLPHGAGPGFGSVGSHPGRA